MQARIAPTAFIAPDAMEALQTLGKCVKRAGVSLPIKLACMRASQINGCSACVDMHGRALKKAGESDGRTFAIAAWREAAYFTDAERAALALADAVTRLSDRADPVPDDVWNEAARHFEEPELATLVLAIATTNLFNRLSVATRQMAGVPDQAAMRDGSRHVRAPAE
jgi:AhpD family alkylhydroperoxidase